VGHGQLFKPAHAFFSEYDRALTWTIATNHSPARHHGYLANLCVPDSLVVSASNYGNTTAWRLAAGWIETLLAYSIQNGALVFRVQVVPRASRSEVLGERNGALRVRLAAPPVNGAANDELRRLLAKTLNVKRSSVELVSGQSSRTKQIRIAGVDQEGLKRFTDLCETGGEVVTGY